MPASFTCDGRALRLVISEQPEWREIRDAFEAGLADPAFQPMTTKLIVDVRQTELAPSVERLRTLAERLADYAPRLGGIAIIAGDPLRYGLARMLGTFAETRGARIRVFSSPDAAERWAAGRARGRGPGPGPDPAGPIRGPR